MFSVVNRGKDLNTVEWVGFTYLATSNFEYYKKCLEGKLL